MSRKNRNANRPLREDGIKRAVAAGKKVIRAAARIERLLKQADRGTR